AAEASQIVDHLVDLLLRKGFSKRGHDFGESSGMASTSDGCFPIGVQLAGCAIAVGEIGKSGGWLEPQGRLRLALAVRTVATHACRLEDLFASREFQAASDPALRKSNTLQPHHRQSNRNRKMSPQP